VYLQLSSLESKMGEFKSNLSASTSLKSRYDHLAAVFYSSGCHDQVCQSLVSIVRKVWTDSLKTSDKAIANMVAIRSVLKATKNRIQLNYLNKENSKNSFKNLLPYLLQKN
jgi:hypothetical protein